MMRRQIMTAWVSALVLGCLMVGSVVGSSLVFNPNDDESMEARINALESWARTASLDINHWKVHGNHGPAHTGGNGSGSGQNGNPDKNPNGAPNGPGGPSGGPGSNSGNTGGTGNQPNTNGETEEPTTSPTPELTSEPECTEGDKRSGEWQDIGREKHRYENRVLYIGQDQWQQREKCIDGKWKEVSAGQRTQWRQR